MLTDEEAIALGATHRHWQGDYYQLLVDDARLEGHDELKFRVYRQLKQDGTWRIARVVPREGFYEWLTHPRTGAAVRRFERLRP